MCHYHHLTLSERENLLFFRAQSYSISRIAAASAEINPRSHGNYAEIQ